MGGANVCEEREAGREKREGDTLFRKQREEKQKKKIKTLNPKGMGRRENEMEAGGGASRLGLVGLGRSVGQRRWGEKKT